jgi:hypothetical protein
MKAANNASGIPRVRKTWRLDNGILAALAVFSAKNEWPESEIVEEALGQFLAQNGVKVYVKNRKK